MEREVSMEEISDGRRYRSTDMARIGCRDCEGCSECCHVMEDTIILDPYDLWQLQTHLKVSPEELLNGRMELAVYQGIILPHLTLGANGCSFLTEQGRCSIHAFRPGLCRLFPLGRVYENGGFSYFVQVGQCPAKMTTKVRIDKWLDLPDLKKYEAYVLAWHDYLARLKERIEGADDETVKSENLRMLRTFFLTPYEEGDFYTQFYERM